MYRILLGILIAAATGCVDDSGSDGDGERDRGVIQDAERDVYYVDVRRFDLGIGNQPDFGLLPDAAPARCLREGAALSETYSGDSIGGQEGLSANLDLDGDGTLELVLRSREEQSYSFAFMSGLPPVEIGRFSFETAGDARFMTRLPRNRGINRPIRFGDSTAVYAVSQTETTLTILFADSETFEVLQTFELMANVDTFDVIAAGQYPAVLVNLADGGCVIQGVTAESPSFTRESCRVRTGWDVNGDGVPEAIRQGSAGLALFDVVVGEDIAVEADHHARAAGFGPNGPMDLRGMGPELVTASFEGQQLSVTYHDPIDLTPNGDPQNKTATNGSYQRVEFHMFEGLPRLVAEYDRLGVHILQIYEPGETLRKVAQFGPYRFLSWSVGDDVDGDQIPELLVMGGSREDGFNTKLDYRSLRNGSQSLVISAVRTAKFTPIWATGDVPGPADLDGCENDDRVTLRSGSASEDGTRSTRVLFHDDEGVETVRSESYSGRVHELVITDLDGASPYELIELRSDDETSATLRVYGPHSSAPPAESE